MQRSFALSVLAIIWCLQAGTKRGFWVVQGFRPFTKIQPPHSTTIRAAYTASTTTTTTTTTTTNSLMETLSNKPVDYAPTSLLPDWMLGERTKCLTSATMLPKSASSSSSSSCVVYWMQRDMRTSDNWALLWACSLATERNLPLRVVYVLPPPPASSAQQEDDDDEPVLPPTLAEMPMTARHGDFLLGGLEQVHAELRIMGISFHVLLPPSHDFVGQTVCDHILQSTWNACLVVSDFSPLRQPRQWMELQAAPELEKAQVPLYQVDAHNIVPVWIAGEGKRQIGARTLRPRIHRVIDKYLQDFPTLDSVYGKNKNKNTEDENDSQTGSDTANSLPQFNRGEYEKFLKMDQSVPPVEWAIPGTKAGMKQFRSFVENGLKTYGEQRNDPTQKHVCSNLSPWTNHGHISFQRITMEVKKLNKYANGTSGFVEEGVIRRELSDNFLYYTPNEYDTLGAALGWAQETLQVHEQDDREWLYTLQQLEEGCTHDDLWNAAQLQVVREGQMHGFLRMYWAKKILEWTTMPEFALRAAQYLNDKFALDGKDPNGFVGVGWSIMGIHDQGWKEREIFGKIRYMNYKGCQRKFNVAKLVSMYKGASQNAALASGQNTLKDKKKNMCPSILHASVTHDA